MFTLNEFITHLKLTKAYTSKQLLVIDYISIYLNDSKVYKVIIVPNPSMMKKATKLGLNDYKTIFFDSVNPNDAISIKHAPKKGKCIIMYYPNNDNDYSIYEGEIDESTQINKLKGQHSSYNLQ